MVWLITKEDTDKDRVGEGNGWAIKAMQALHKGVSSALKFSGRLLGNFNLKSEIILFISVVVTNAPSPR